MRRWFFLLVAVVMASLVVSCGSIAIPGSQNSGGTGSGSGGGSGGGSGTGSGGGTASGYLAVSDPGNSRVLIYDGPFTTNESAAIVLGQPNFTSKQWNQGEGTQPGPNALDGPGGLAMDSSGNLWVVDTENCRVLEFRPPFHTTMNASLVIGQPDFGYDVQGCTAVSSPGPAGLGQPEAVAFDAHGDLWISDLQASRVTEYVPPFTNGMAASISIGQADLDDGYQCNGENDTVGAGSDAWPPPPTASSLCSPHAIAFDSHGDLWVSDGGNGRALEFVPPFSTGMSASLEIGKPDFDTGANQNCEGPSATNMCGASAISFDSHGNLWIADPSLGRVLEFAPAFSNGMSASLVVGEPNFSTTWDNTNADGLDMQPPSADTLSTPYAISFDASGNLFVADSQFNRLLVFAPPFASGMSASVVLGQPNMTTGNFNNFDSGTDQCPQQQGANTLCYPDAALPF